MQDLINENERLRLRLLEAEETLAAIKSGEIDALVVSGPAGDQVFTLTGADRAYRILFETMNEGAAILASDGSILYCNNKLSAMLHMPLETLLGTSIRSFVQVPSAPLVESFLEDGVESRQKMEIELNSGNGNVIPCNISTSPFLLEDTSAICAILTDLTERKQAELALAQSEERLRLVFGVAADAFWDWNVRDASIIREARWASILGYEEIDSSLQAWKELVHPDDLPRVLAVIKNCFEGKADRYENEYRIKTKWGDWKWIQDQAQVVERDSQGTPLRVVGALIDITRRRKAETALRESEERFRAVFEGSEDSIWIKDKDLQITHINPSAARDIGLTVEELIGRKDSDLLDGETAKHFEEIDLRVLAGESLAEQRTVLIDGTEGLWNISKVPMRDASGEIVGLCGIARNVSDWQSRRHPPKTSPGEPVSYSSHAMISTLSLARTAARRAATILLTGESGSGKDWLARYIHDHSDRANGPYFSINCAAIASELAESELFGHEKGAFTGAVGRKRGLLELAEGGTLLLNEIGDLAPRLQSKLLTFLDLRKFTRVGGEKEIPVNARLLAATNRDLARDVDTGRFRMDLFFRINVMSIEVPPLRNRIEDIPMLVHNLLSRIQTELALHEMPRVDRACMEAIKTHHWPGNVRELGNVLERAVILSDGRPITRAHLAIQASVQQPSMSVEPRESISLSGTLEECTDRIIRERCLMELRSTGGNKKIAAQNLGIARDSLYRYIRKLGITGKDYR